MPATLQANLVSEVNLYRAKNSRQGIFSSDWKVYRATQPELLDRVWEIPLEVGKNASEKLLDPVTGQFLTLDPAVDSTLSPYAYVAGNPLNATDPNGMFCVLFFQNCTYGGNSCFIGNPDGNCRGNFGGNAGAVAGWAQQNPGDAALTLIPIPAGAVEKVAVRLGEVALDAVRAAQAAQKFARAVNLPEEALAVRSRSMSVQQFMSSYCKGSVQVPGQYLGMSVEDALRVTGPDQSILRKVLTNRGGNYWKPGVG